MSYRVAASRLLRRSVLTNNGRFVSSAVSSVSDHRSVPSEATEVACVQCERAKDGVGCGPTFVCGKTDAVNALQDTLFHLCKGTSQLAAVIRDNNVDVPKRYVRLLPDVVTSITTNSNFNEDSLEERIYDVLHAREHLLATFWDRVGDEKQFPAGAATWLPQSSDKTGLIDSAAEISVASRSREHSPDIFALAELLANGVKGLCAYYLPLQSLTEYNATPDSYNDDLPEVEHVIYHCLGYIAGNEMDASVLMRLLIQCGSATVDALRRLRVCHEYTFGKPHRMGVRTTPVKGQALLVTGHDLTDLEATLYAAEKEGVNVYTHGEMLPAHGYPALNSYKNLVGHYGGAWQNQHQEFEAFPGSIVATSNCIIPPLRSYANRFITLNATSSPRESDSRGLYTAENSSISLAIRLSKRMKGFVAEEEASFTSTGTSINTSAVRDDIADALQAGKLRHIFVVGGCDGTEGERSYYTEFAEAIPEDTMVLTMGCAKFRLTQKKSSEQFGIVPGTKLPRLMDIGQCNDTITAILFAQNLAETLSRDSVNNLPLTFVFSWFEQKSIALLLALLACNFRNIYLGPRQPAFMSPSVLEFLRETYNLRPITTPKEDIAAVLKAPRR